MANLNLKDLPKLALGTANLVAVGADGESQLIENAGGESPTLEKYLGIDNDGKLATELVPSFGENISFQKTAGAPLTTFSFDITGIYVSFQDPVYVVKINSSYSLGIGITVMIPIAGTVLAGRSFSVPVGDGMVASIVSSNLVITNTLASGTRTVNDLVFIVK